MEAQAGLGTGMIIEARVEDTCGATSQLPCIRASQRAASVGDQGQMYDAGLVG